jgi:hypothetical protein
LGIISFSPLLSMTEQSHHYYNGRNNEQAWIGEPSTFYNTEEEKHRIKAAVLIWRKYNKNQIYLL